MVFAFTAHGHPSILSSHPTTLEITTEPHLTKRGDCIIAVKAACGLQDLPSNIKNALSTEKGHGKLTIRVRDQTFTVEGRGSNGLTFTHPKGGVLHHYTFVEGLDYEDKAVNELEQALASHNWRMVEKVGARAVRGVARLHWQVVVDARAAPAKG